MRRMCVLSDCPVGAVAVLMLADQMLSRVEYVHSKSFLHRSVFLTWWLGLVVVAAVSFAADKSPQLWRLVCGRVFLSLICGPVCLW